MRPIIQLPLILAFLISTFPVYSQETLQLKLHEGQKIRFSYTHSSKSHEPLLTSVRTEDIIWETELLIRQKTDENRLMIELMPKRYRYNERSGPRKLFRHFDSSFAVFHGNEEFQIIPWLAADILCSMKIPMELNQQTNKLKFRNIEDLNKNIDRILKDRKIDPEYLKSTKEKVLHNVNEICRITRDYLLHFHRANFGWKDSSGVTDNDYVVSRSDKMIRLVRKQSITKKGRPEEHTEDVKLNADNGLILESNLTVFRPAYTRKINQLIPAQSEKIIYRLVSDSEIRQGETKVSGYIEHPTGRRVHIQFLDDPAGTALKTFTTFLDSANRFSISIPLKRESFLFVSNIYNENWLWWANKTKVIYAEPGDQISFDLTGVNEIIEHRGDRTAENSFLTRHMPSLEIERTAYIQNKKTPIRYSISLPFLLNGIPGHIETLKDCDDFILTDQLKDHFPGSDFSSRFKNYFSNEVAMAKLNLACSVQMNLQIFPETEMDDELKKVYFNLKLFTDTFQICRYYNEYGYFSRKAVSDYT